MYGSVRTNTSVAAEGSSFVFNLLTQMAIVNVSNRKFLYAPPRLFLSVCRRSLPA